MNGLAATDLLQSLTHCVVH